MARGELFQIDVVALDVILFSERLTSDQGLKQMHRLPESSRFSLKIKWCHYAKVGSVWKWCKEYLAVRFFFERRIRAVCCIWRSSSLDGIDPKGGRRHYCYGWKWLDRLI